jgi:hypothetical protein
MIKLNLDGITVESFQTQETAMMVSLTRTVPIDERPVGWETDAAQNSMCFVSCAGSCGC